MHEDHKMLLAIVARMLIYPDEDSVRERQELKQWIEEDMQSESAKKALHTTLDGLWEYPLMTLQQIYVDTFDWQESTGLYLTAHEYGDDRKRGGGLIQLQITILEAGFEREEDELADYMPMLYELLAATDKVKIQRKLFSRLGKATWRVMEAISEDHPYKSVFVLLTDFVFEKPTAKEMQNMGEEKPDLDPMPFPMMYD